MLPNQADGLHRLESRDFSGLSEEVEANIIEVPSLRVAIPKFSMASDVDMKEILFRLGMIDLFHETTADLTGMSQTRGLYVSSTVHRCILEMNEEGAEEGNVLPGNSGICGGVTYKLVNLKLQQNTKSSNAYLMQILGFATEFALPATPPFIANHPFYYYVKSRENNAVLLAGRLVSPQRT